MQDLGHSIIGDKKYGSTKNPLRRMGLHARVLAFRHPITGEEVRFETEIPKEFLSLFGGQQG
jgi:23S rRNA pseudouridine1911/1915/1917 synthase